jgi:hypothetical protein
MNASTQSQPSTNKPLPKTQQSLLWKLERFPSLLIWDQSSVAKTAKVLAKKGMIAGVAQGDGFTRYTLVKVEAPIATEEAASEDELSAKMPLAPLMDADTMPVMDVQTVATKPEYAEGQIVRFHYWLSNVDNSVYTGRINGFKSSVTFGETALIEPIKNAYHLTPRYVPMSRIIEVVSNEADVFEPAFTFADVQRLEKAWFAAQSAPRNFDEAISEPFYSRTRNAHTAYLIAYAMFHNAPWMMPCAEDIEALRGPQNAPQTPHNGTPAPVDDVQAFSANLDQRKPEIASEPFAPVNATNDHPLALIQPGSVASKTDWDALKVYRAQQYATAKARVDENMKRVMGGGL